MMGTYDEWIGTTRTSGGKLGLMNRPKKVVPSKNMTASLSTIPNHERSNKYPRRKCSGINTCMRKACFVAGKRPGPLKGRILVFHSARTKYSFIRLGTAPVLNTRVTVWTSEDVMNIQRSTLELQCFNRSTG